MNIIADPKYDGTLERTIALVLDHNLIACPSLASVKHPNMFMLSRELDMGDLVAAIAKAVRKSPEITEATECNEALVIQTKIDQNSLDFYAQESRRLNKQIKDLQSRISALEDQMQDQAVERMGEDA